MLWIEGRSVSWSLFWTVILYSFCTVISVDQTVFVQYFTCVVFLSSLCILSFRLLMSVPLKDKFISWCWLYSGFITLRILYDCAWLNFFSLFFCFMYSDVNSMYLSSTEPPAAAEWACLLRPLRGREPEGIWNLLSIVREMFKRRDSNAAPLLEILTDQCLNYEQVSLCLKWGMFWGIRQSL